MKTIEQLKTEIKNTDSRLSELREMHRSQSDQFDRAQRDFIAGKINLDELSAAQSRLNLLSQTIETLRQSRDEQQAALDNVIAVETRHNSLLEAKATAEAAAATQAEYLKAREELHSIIAEKAEKLHALGQKLGKEKKRCRQLIEETGGDVSELRKLGLSDEARTVAQATHFNVEPLKFGEPIQVCLNILSNEMDRERRKQSSQAQAVRSNITPLRAA